MLTVTTHTFNSNQRGVFAANHSSSFVSLQWRKSKMEIGIIQLNDTQHFNSLNASTSRKWDVSPLYVKGGAIFNRTTYWLSAVWFFCNSFSHETSIDVFFLPFASKTYTLSNWCSRGEHNVLCDVYIWVTILDNVYYSFPFVSAKCLSLSNVCAYLLRFPSTRVKPSRREQIEMKNINFLDYSY